MLTSWESFYVIVGSAGAGLTGLMFVVVSLLPDARRRVGGSEDSIDAFGTPTVVHFCFALLVSAIMSTPWPALSQAGTGLTLSGFAGVVYAVMVVRRVRSQKDYTPVLEDWLWHLALPFVAYGGLAVAGLFVRGGQTAPLFTVAAATLLLLFIGIHNAWDTVTYMALQAPAHVENPAPPPLPIDAPHEEPERPDVGP
jgi:hypothetical protein